MSQVPNPSPFDKPGATELLDRAAKALYDHWCGVENPFEEYCDWDLLADKATWRERARAMFKGIAGDPGHDATECVVKPMGNRSNVVWIWDRIVSNAAGGDHAD